jgi:hypothetical protein
MTKGEPAPRGRFPLANFAVRKQPVTVLVRPVIDGRSR